MKQDESRSSKLEQKPPCPSRPSPASAHPANDQGNDYFSVAYWYQTGKHADHSGLPPVEERLPHRWPDHGLWDE